MKYSKELLILVSLILAAGLLFTADSYADEKPKYIGREGSSHALRIPAMVTREARLGRYREFMSELAEADTSDIVDLQNEIAELEDSTATLSGDTEAEIIVEDDISTDADTTVVNSEDPSSEDETKEDDGGDLNIIF